MTNWRGAPAGLASLLWVSCACGGSAPSRPQDSTAAATRGYGRQAADGSEAGGEREPRAPTASTLTPQPRPMVTASGEWTELLDADASVREALALALPACADGAEHLERLCGLAERICTIAEESGDPDAGDRCTDGAARCERSRRAYEDACDE